MVMKAVLNVLQDDGFIVKNAVPELGLLTASKELPVERMASDPFGGFGPMASVILGGATGHSHDWGWGGGWGSGGDDRPVSKHSIVEVSANVSEYGSVTRVRVNFQKTTIDNRGGTIDASQIDDPKFYEEFFSKVDKGIYLQREKL